MRTEHKEQVLSEVIGRIVERVVRGANHPLGPIPAYTPSMAQSGGGAPAAGARRDSDAEQAELVLLDTLYHERQRLERDPGAPSARRDRVFWEEISRALPRHAEAERLELTRRIVAHFAGEIIGHFSPTVYQLTTRVVPPALSLLLHALSPRRLFSSFPELQDLTSRLVIRGESEQLRGLRARGTVVLAPTHLSNLDSLAVGWALHFLGLPPFTYGAGLNLFINPLTSFFMHHLGAYTVDRKKTAPLYKESLKEYATVTMELGYDNLFFPGGTRSRSGAVERHLKLGLLGAGLRAYINNLKRGKDRPNIYVVPCTLNYQLVLEAETLIADYLAETGKSRFVILDDEFSQPQRIAEFLRNIMGLDSTIYLVVSRALDPFGNRVDDEGRSLDPAGRPIDIRRYVSINGSPEHFPARDEEYTRELGREVAAAFARDNLLMSTHLVAFCVFRMLVADNPGVDLFRLLRTGGTTESFSMYQVEEAMIRVLDAVRQLARAGAVRCDERLAKSGAEQLISNALRYFGTYHRRPVLERRGDRLYAVDRNLLYYYHNRATGYGLEASAATGVLAGSAKERS
ncbi:MAG: 1-acyl-sn-glycerol-3-phosphate acyltransferase [Candidatus Schekmanbacteria bacterium]|nr:1-acyl-sn-glycerol-3-phosphate acyltransferase [Candidatus Schekmanbacteria bacterium]